MFQLFIDKKCHCCQVEDWNNSSSDKKNIFINNGFLVRSKYDYSEMLLTILVLESDNSITTSILKQSNAVWNCKFVAVGVIIQALEKARHHKGSIVFVRAQSDQIVDGYERVFLFTEETNCTLYLIYIISNIRAHQNAVAYQSHCASNWKYTQWSLTNPG